MSSRMKLSTKMSSLASRYRVRSALASIAPLGAKTPAGLCSPATNRHASTRSHPSRILPSSPVRTYNIRMSLPWPGSRMLEPRNRKVLRSRSHKARSPNRDTPIGPMLCPLRAPERLPRE
jgi:hypothetical protein